MEIKSVSSELFLQNVIELNEFLENKWSIKVAKDFLKILDGKMNLILKYPLIGAPSKFGSRKILITKHNRLYYRVKGHEITFLQLFDTRQNPQKIKYE